MTLREPRSADCMAQNFNIRAPTAYSNDHYTPLTPIFLEKPIKANQTNCVPMIKSITTRLDTALDELTLLVEKNASVDPSSLLPIHPPGSRGAHVAFLQRLESLDISDVSFHSAGYTLRHLLAGFSQLDVLCLPDVRDFSFEDDEHPVNPTALYKLRKLEIEVVSRSSLTNILSCFVARIFNPSNSLR